LAASTGARNCYSGCSAYFRVPKLPGTTAIKASPHMECSPGERRPMAWADLVPDRSQRRWGAPVSRGIGEWVDRQGTGWGAAEHVLAACCSGSWPAASGQASHAPALALALALHKAAAALATELQGRYWKQQVLGYAVYLVHGWRSHCCGSGTRLQCVSHHVTPITCMWALVTHCA
jgi:hypothetical protein